MRRKYIFFICICLILTLFNATTYASIIEPTNYQTRFTNITLFENAFDISSDGQASVDSYLVARNVDSVKVTAKLQQYKDGKWKTIKSWSETRDGTRCGAGGKWYVASGNKYRMISYGYAYVDGDMVENTSYVSKTKVY